jgi:hypothetical protein
MPRTFDEYGAIVAEIPAGRSTVLDGLSALADTVAPIDNTVGGAIWDWLHPAQRQAEYDLTGRTAPPVTAADVVDIAVARTMDAAAAARDSFTQGFRLAGYALVGIAIIYVLRKTRRK